MRARLRGGIIPAACAIVLLVAGGLPAGVRAQDPPAAHRIQRLGGSTAFCRTPLESVADLQALFRDRHDEIQEALRQAGFAAESQPLFAKVQAGDVTETEFEVGTQMQWMALRKHGRVGVTGGVEWAGENPFPAYQIDYRSGGVDYVFVVPKACSNVALLESRPVPSATLIVSPPSACVCEPLRIDASGSTVKEGSISHITVTVARPDGQQETLRAGNPAEARWSETYRVPGVYTVTAVAVSERGAASDAATASAALSPCPPVAELAVTPRERAEDNTVLVDASGSHAEVTSIERVRVDVTYERTGASEQVELSSPFRTEVTLRHSGTHIFTAVAEDGCGQWSSPVADTLESCRQPRWSVVADALGGFARRTRGDGVSSDGVAGTRAGASYLLRPTFEIAATIGGAYDLEKGARSGFFADLEADLVKHGYFLGAGGGGWDLNRDATRTGSIFVHGGIAVAHPRCRLPVYLIAEGRVLTDELDHIGDNYVIWAGLRVHAI